MKVEIDRFELRLVPENELEKAYMEEVLALKSPDKTAIAEPVYALHPANAFPFFANDIELVGPLSHIRIRSLAEYMGHKK